MQRDPGKGVRVVVKGTYPPALPQADLYEWLRDHVLRPLEGSPQWRQLNYDLRRFEDEKRHAMEAWAARVLSIVEPLPDKVIRLK
jgi:hypothetical protein